MMMAPTAWPGQAIASSSSLHHSPGDARASPSIVEVPLPAAEYEDHKNLRRGNCFIYERTSIF